MVKTLLFFPGVFNSISLSFKTRLFNMICFDIFVLQFFGASLDTTAPRFTASRARLLDVIEVCQKHQNMALSFSANRRSVCNKFQLQSQRRRERAPKTGKGLRDIGVALIVFGWQVPALPGSALWGIRDPETRWTLFDRPLHMNHVDGSYRAKGRFSCVQT